MDLKFPGLWFLFPKYFVGLLIEERDPIKPCLNIGRLKKIRKLFLSRAFRYPKTQFFYYYVKMCYYETPFYNFFPLIFPALTTIFLTNLTLVYSVGYANASKLLTHLSHLCSQNVW
jgi:hypothetical protein